MLKTTNAEGVKPFRPTPGTPDEASALLELSRHAAGVAVDCAVLWDHVGAVPEEKQHEVCMALQAMQAGAKDLARLLKDEAEKAWKQKRETK